VLFKRIFNSVFEKKCISSSRRDKNMKKTRL
jgi:hypothetical protein